MPPQDSTLEASEVQVAAWRALSPVERLEVAVELSEGVMALTVAGIRDRRPDLDDDGVAAELHRILGHGDLVG